MTLPWMSCRLENAAAHVVGGGSGGGGSFAYIASVSAGSVDSNTASTYLTLINTTGADLLIVAVADYEGGGGGTVSDTVIGHANSWTALTAASNISAARTRIYYSKPTYVGSDHRFDYTGTGNYSAIFAAAFSGSHATPFDVEATTGTTGSSSTASAGSGITPSQNNELVIASVATASTVSSISSPFTILVSQAYSAGLYFGGALAYRIQTSAVLADPDWTLAGSDSWAASIASFKAV